MISYQIPYGQTSLTFTLPENHPADLIAPVEAVAVADPLRSVSEVIDSPLGGQTISDFAGARSVAIAINDKTRPVPLGLLLPPLLQRLEALGLPPQAITLLIATGTHRPMPPDEFAAVLPPNIVERYRVLSHDCDDESNLFELGVTERGTLVKVSRHFYQADLRIAVGNIEPHQFAGFSGGVKTAAIGLAGRAGINHNHALMMLPESRLGDYETNPLRQDIDSRFE